MYNVGISMLVSGSWSLKNACGYELNVPILVRQPQEGGQERIGYLSSCVVKQPKHTFFCLNLGRAYHAITNNMEPGGKSLANVFQHNLEIHFPRNGYCSKCLEF